MRWLLCAALLVCGCSRNERPGSTAGESVPRPQVIIDNAVPNDMPPAVPPIPPTSRSPQNMGFDAGQAPPQLWITPLAPPKKPTRLTPTEGVVDAGFFEVPAPPHQDPIPPPQGGVSPQQ
ncbi:MAG: hypothetical protein JST54_30930 [Deltaproteobacteria bacterium]|nr:hypothetical protein [Deltaproteobacteria bacterium]